jgi:hypothetical protein
MNKPHSYKLLHDSNVYEQLSFKKLWCLIVWSIFHKYKFDHFLKDLENGMSAYFAFKRARLVDKDHN